MEDHVVREFQYAVGGLRPLRRVRVASRDPAHAQAFAAGASFAGAMGMVFAAKQTFVNPDSFTFMESIGVLAMVILGIVVGKDPAAMNIPFF